MCGAERAREAFHANLIEGICVVCIQLSFAGWLAFRSQSRVLGISYWVGDTYLLSWIGTRLRLPGA